MPNTDPIAAFKLQPELLPGESIYWAGMPSPAKIFHADDIGQIPLSLMWGGFATFLLANVLGYINFGAKPSSRPSSAPFMALLLIPTVLMGQYMIWGRFFLDAWLKRRTYYAVTNRRVLLLQEGWKTQRRFLFLEALPEILREGTTIGTLWLGPKLATVGVTYRDRIRHVSLLYLGDSTPVLADIPEADRVERLILDLREKSRVPA